MRGYSAVYIYLQTIGDSPIKYKCINWIAERQTCISVSQKSRTTNLRMITLEMRINYVKYCGIIVIRGGQCFMDCQSLAVSWGRNRWLLVPHEIHEHWTPTNKDSIVRIVCKSEIMPKLLTNTWAHWRMKNAYIIIRDICAIYVHCTCISNDIRTLRSRMCHEWWKFHTWNIHKLYST